MGSHRGPDLFDHAAQAALRGAVHHAAGQAAEDIVARHYLRLGYVLRETRWRGPHGEIDLILQLGPTCIFVEVKKSRTFDRAAQRIRPRQVERIYAAAQDYLDQVGLGGLTPCRFDAGLVDGTGAVELRAGALSDFV